MGTGYVLAVVRPPEGEAKFGKATVLEPMPDMGRIFTQIYWELRKRDGGMHPEVANKHAQEITSQPTATDVVEASTGLTFRIEPEDRAPNICPCCTGLVKFGVHAFAGREDAYCTGCYTWDRSTPGCLPGNSAHTSLND